MNENEKNKTEPSTDIKSTDKSITVLGVKYRSLLHAAQVLGVKQSTVYARQRRGGWSLEQMLGLAPPPARSGGCNGVAVQVNGKEYRNRTQAAEAHGLSLACVYERLRNGANWSVEEAYTVPCYKRERGGKSVTVQGQTFSSIKKAAEHFKADVRRAYTRLAAGHCVEKALGLVPLNDTDRPVEFRGEIYENLKAATDALELSYPTIKARIDNGWSINKALSKPITPRKIKYLSDITRRLDR